MWRMETADRPLRADAERNRRRIVEAARGLFAERGLAVSLDDIADAAGVGIGTVYRRYPDKDALIDALFAERLDEMVGLARSCLEMDDPWDAFATFVRSVCRLNARDRGLKEVLLSGSRGRDKVQQARAAMAPVAGAVLRRAQEAGVVRPDVTDVDMPLMHFALGAVAERTSDVAPDYWDRLCTVWLDGLAVRRDAPTPLPAPPLDEQQFTAAMARGRGPRR